MKYWYRALGPDGALLMEASDPDDIIDRTGPAPEDWGGGDWGFPDGTVFERCGVWQGGTPWRPWDEPTTGKVTPRAERPVVEVRNRPGETDVLDVVVDGVVVATGWNDGEAWYFRPEDPHSNLYLDPFTATAHAVARALGAEVRGKAEG